MAMIRRILRKLFIAKVKNRFKRLSIINTDKIRFGTKASITLYNGSTQEDIVIEDNSFIYGIITSSGGGKVKIGRYSQLGTNSCIRSVESVIIGDFTAVANNVMIQDNNSHPVSPYDRIILQQTPHRSKERGWEVSTHAAIVIGNNCWIGEGSRIHKGVTIGDGSIVAAGSIVTKSVPANCIVAGNPAVIVKNNIDKLPRVFRDSDYPTFERL